MSGFHGREKRRYVAKHRQAKGGRECTTETDTFEKVAERKGSGHCLEQEQSRWRARKKSQAWGPSWASGRKSGWPAGLDGGAGKERPEMRSGVGANTGLTRPSEQREGRCSRLDEKPQVIWGKKAILGVEGGRQEWQGLGEDATGASTHKD